MWVSVQCMFVCAYVHTQVEVRGQHQVSYWNHLPFEKGSLPGPSPHGRSGNLQIYTRTPTAQTTQPCLCFLSECWESKLRSSRLDSRDLVDAHLPCPSVVFLFVSVTITFFPTVLWVVWAQSDGSAALLGMQVHICRCSHPRREHPTWSPAQTVWVCQKQ